MNAIACPPQRLAASEKDTLTGLQQTISASQLNVFLHCRLKFYFRYVLVLSKAKTPSLHVGSCVHSVLKAWNKARWRQQQLSLADIHKAFLVTWSNQSAEPVDWRDADEESEKPTAWRLCETCLRKATASAGIKPDAVEVPGGGGYVEARIATSHWHSRPSTTGRHY